MTRLPRRGTAFAAALITALSPLAAGCSGDDEPLEPAAASASPTAEPVEFVVRSDVGKITGRVGRSERREVVKDVGRVVGDWMEASYLSAGKQVDLDAALARFSDDAAAQARRDRSLLSNAALRGAGDVVPRRATVKVDVLAPGGEVAGATARFRIAFDTADRKRGELVSGRLMLTPVKRGWQVFGYSVDRGAAPAKAAGKDDASKDDASKDDAGKKGQE
ncbi:hypothetical protein [Nocardioides sp. YIM 152588]|uniref:hypothetical protein n=1 Tax=Nocardioides sp. YIM 152588 TaxID=3158259 RepID=UPI0032E468B5